MGYVRFDRAAINRKREVLEPLFLARRYESAIVLDGVSDRHSGHHIGDTEIRARHLFVPGSALRPSHRRYGDTYGDTCQAPISKD